MKKVLLTSTALVLVAGAAAAEVSITGSADLGIQGGTVEVNGVDTTTPANFWQDVEVFFKMSGETDSGLAFGTKVDLDEAGNLGNSYSNQGVEVFISGDFGRLALGDTDGAIDFVLVDAGNAGNPGSMDDTETLHAGYRGNFLDGAGDNQVLRYDYSVNSFTIAVSVEQIPTGAAGQVVDGDDGLNTGIGVAYAFDMAGASVSVGAGYQSAQDGNFTLEASGETIFSTRADDITATAVGASMTMDNGLTAALTYAMYSFDDADVDLNHVGIGVGYTMDALTLHANYGSYSADELDAFNGYGIAVNYDLGGGLSLNGAINGSNVEAGTDEITASRYALGLIMNF